MHSHLKTARRSAPQAPSALHPETHVRPLEAVVLVVTVLAGVVLTGVLAADHSGLDVLGLLVTLVAVYGATRAVAPPAPRVVLDYHAQDEALARILDMRAKGEITTDEAERLLLALHVKADQRQLR